LDSIIAGVTHVHAIDSAPAQETRQEAATKGAQASTTRPAAAPVKPNSKLLRAKPQSPKAGPQATSTTRPAAPQRPNSKFLRPSVPAQSPKVTFPGPKATQTAPAAVVPHVEVAAVPHTAESASWSGHVELERPMGDRAALKGAQAITKHSITARKGHHTSTR
jgi:hypothetical protein